MWLCCIIKCSMVSKEKVTSLCLWTILPPWIRKERKDWRHHKQSDQCVSRVFSSSSQNTAFFLIFPWPWPTVPVACMACDNHINLCCLSLSLSPPYFFLSLCSSVTFSNSLWKPKELVRAWLTPLFTPPHSSSLHLCSCLVFSVFLLCVFWSKSVCQPGPMSSVCLCQWCYNLMPSL